MAKLANSLRTWQADNKDTGTRGHGFTIDPRALYVRPDFNVRNLDEMSPEMLAEYNDYIQGLADAYKAGRFVNYIDVKMVDGRPTLVDGHTRYKGMMLAIEQGADLSRTPVNEFKGDDIDEVSHIATSNNNRKLRPLELAVLYKRLEGLGKSNADIAQTVGHSVAHVIQTKAYYLMPAALKTLVNLDKIAVDEAAKLFGEYGTKSVAVAEELISKAESQGKKKVTSKTSSPKLTAKEKRTLTTVSASLFEAVKDIEVKEGDGNLTVELTPEMVLQLQAIGARAHEVETFVPDAIKQNSEELDTVVVEADSAVNDTQPVAA